MLSNLSILNSQASTIAPAKMGKVHAPNRVLVCGCSCGGVGNCVLLHHNSDYGEAVETWNPAESEASYQERKLLFT
jgi:hypothetical protein